MKIKYRKHKDYLSVDIQKLRPKDSYKDLFNKRTHSIDKLVKEFGKIPNELLIKRRCPSCGSSNYSLSMEKDYMKIVCCDSCGLIYTNPIFNEDHYKKLYQSSEYQNIMKNLGEDSHDYRVERFGMERVKIMSDFLISNKVDYLDVGCSTGFVVEAAKQKGWNAIGIDLNPSAISFGVSKGLDLYNSSLEDFDSEMEFDAISLFDVLEHLVNPSDILKQVSKKLKSGGILFLYVPNWDSASRFLLNKDAHFIWPTHHLNYYSPKTITSFLESFDYDVELITTEGLDLVDYCWFEEEINGNQTDQLKKIIDQLQFFINAGGYGKNLRVLARKK